MNVLEDDKQRAVDLMRVSRETILVLDVFVALLQRWSKITDLISPDSMQHLWTRHIADSAQLIEIETKARTWLDLGTGAGFPGLIIGILLRNIPGIHVGLVESDKRKVAFLKEAARLTAAPVTVHGGRISNILPTLPYRPDVITSRAFAPMKELIEISRPNINLGTVALFLKGEKIAAEIAEVSPDSALDVTLIKSRTSNTGSIVRICLASNVRNPSQILTN